MRADKKRMAGAGIWDPRHLARVRYLMGMISGGSELMKSLR